MTADTLVTTGAKSELVLRDCIETLERVAEYHLPPAVDRRLTWLAENKSQLSEIEREELLALAELAEERTLEKVQALSILKRLAVVRPDLASNAL